MGAPGTWALVALSLAAWDELPPTPEHGREATPRETERLRDEAAAAVTAFEREQRDFARERKRQRGVAVPVEASSPAPRRKPPKVDPKLQAKLDAAEAKAMDYRRRCAEDPKACGGPEVVAERSRKLEGERNAAAEELARRQAELERREAELEEREKQAKEEEERRKKAREGQVKALERQLQQNGSVMGGVLDAMGD